MSFLKLPFFGKKEEFPHQFFALDLGGKIFKVFLLSQPEAGNVQTLGFRKVARAENSPDASLKEAVLELRKDFPDASPATIVGVSGPQTLGFTTVVRSAVERDRDELAAHARQAAFASAAGQLRESLGEPKLEISEIEAEILEVKEMEKLEVYLFTSFASSSYLGQQQELIKRAGLSLWGFSSLSFNLIADLSPSSLANDGEKLNALIFDVGGTKTEISLVFGGQLMETKSFYWEFGDNVNPTVFLDLWLESVSFTLKTFEGVEAFPQKIYLAGGAASFPGLSEAVSSFPWGQEHPFAVAPEVALLEGDRLPLSLKQVALRITNGGSSSNLA